MPFAYPPTMKKIGITCKIHVSQAVQGTTARMWECRQGVSCVEIRRGGQPVPNDHHQHRHRSQEVDVAVPGQGRPGSKLGSTGPSRHETILQGAVETARPSHYNAVNSEHLPREHFALILNPRRGRITAYSSLTNAVPGRIAPKTGEEPSKGRVADALIGRLAHVGWFRIADDLGGIDSGF